MRAHDQLATRLAEPRQQPAACLGGLLLLPGAATCWHAPSLDSQSCVLLPHRSAATALPPPLCCAPLQPGMVVLSELPGALEGLGEEHLVSPEGRPMVPPALVGAPGGWAGAEWEQRQVAGWQGACTARVPGRHGIPRLVLVAAGFGPGAGRCQGFPLCTLCLLPQPSAEEVEEARLFLQASPVARGQMVTLRCVSGIAPWSEGGRAVLQSQ